MYLGGCTFGYSVLTYIFDPSRINHMFVDWHVSWFPIILKDIVINLKVPTLHIWKCMNTMKACEFPSSLWAYMFLQIDYKLICWIFKVPHFNDVLSWHPIMENFRSIHDTHIKLVWQTQHVGPDFFQHGYQWLDPWLKNDTIKASNMLLRTTSYLLCVLKYDILQNLGGVFSMCLM